MVEEAAKGDGPAGEGGTDDTGTWIPVMAEGVIVWREEVMAFFIKVVSSSINLRLLTSRSNPGEDTVAAFCGVMASRRCVMAVAE